jgi:hypothetical protein
MTGSLLIALKFAAWTTLGAAIVARYAAGLSTVFAVRTFGQGKRAIKLTLWHRADRPYAVAPEVTAHARLLAWTSRSSGRWLHRALASLR